MIILHNSHARESREFVAAHRAGATVYDWYEGGREEWWALGGTDKVSAFPSVIVDVPAFTVPARVVGGGAEPVFNVPPEQVAVRTPRNLADVQARLDVLNERLPVTAKLNLNTMNDAPTGRAGP